MTAPRAALAVLFLALAVPVRAQVEERAGAPAPAAEAAPDDVVHLLEIRGGALWLDGRRLPSAAVPDGLDLTGLAMAVEFSGPVTPVVEVDGVAYVLDGERLVRFDESGREGEQVYFLGEPAPAEPPPPAHPGGASLARADDAGLRRASEAAYLRELSASDATLYQKIQREAELEEEMERLAAEVRTTADPAERARLRERLRAGLTEAFDLKQEVREAEIAWAEAQVEDLRRMFDARAARRSMIIEHRLRELVGE